MTATVLYAWPRDDPFFSTLLFLPWIWIGLSQIARRIHARIATGLPLALALTVLSLPFRARLGWPQTDILWASALLVMLGVLMLSWIPQLRRHLEKTRKRDSETGKPGWVFLLLPLLAHAAILPWALEHRQPDGDEPYYLLLSHSLSRDLDIELSNNYRNQDWRHFMERAIEPQPGDPQGADGRFYSRHNALMPLVLAPFYGLAGRLGAALAMVISTAALAWLTLRVALLLWPDRGTGALGAWAVLAFAPPATIYSHQLWVEIPAALLLMVAVDGLIRLRAHETREAQEPWSELKTSALKAPIPLRITALQIAVFQIALAVVLLPLLKMRFLLVAAPIAALALLILRRRRRLIVALALGTTALLTALLVFNAQRYGNPLKMYSSAEWQLFLSPPADYARGAFGMFYDCAFGLFAVAPIWCLILPAVYLLLRRRDTFLIWLTALTTPYLIALAPRLEWYGGWSPPFRYPLVFLPLLALCLVPLLQRRAFGLRLMLPCLIAWTAVLSIFWLVVPGWTYHLADGSNHLLHRLGWMLQSDLARLFPSTVRPRPATWIWIVASLALIPICLWTGKPGSRWIRWTRSWLPKRMSKGHLSKAAFSWVLGIAIALPLLANALPTTMVHWEDGWVARKGGRLEPERWTPSRPSKVGAWMIPARGELRAKIVAGGERIRIRLIARREKLGPETIHIFADDRELAVLSVKKFVFWETLETDILDWPDGATLSLRCPTGPADPQVGIMVDRTELDWF